MSTLQKYFTGDNIVLAILGLFGFRAVSSVLGLGPPFNVFTYMFLFLYSLWLVSFLYKRWS